MDECIEKVAVPQVGEILTGNVTLTVKPVAEGWQAMNLRSLSLQPVR